MKREDFIEITKVHIDTCKKIAEYKTCEKVDCCDCPFSLINSNNDRNGYCHKRIEPAEKFLELFEKDFMQPSAITVPTQKPRYSLIPTHILESVADLLTKGAEKHTNMEDGTVDKDKYIDKLYRHLHGYRTKGVDHEYGHSHLVHLICDAIILLSKED